MTKKANFEQDIQALTKIVESMEAGDLSLEDALKQYEKGIEVSKRCQKTLAEAQQKVKILSDNQKLSDYTDE
jgi:exodeoxyribonuclease VII small subunit